MAEAERPKGCYHHGDIRSFYMKRAKRIDPSVEGLADALCVWEWIGRGQKRFVFRTGQRRG